ncbi:Hypothetical protein CINCED_3A015619 [Cinara cedri]|nr:Hypothetical protein CINCED_3A015619 [Cinara cedri]
MATFTTPRKSLRFRKTEPSPFLSNRKRELFPGDNLDEDGHDIVPLQKSPEVYTPGFTTPKTSYNIISTPITELSPTMSDQFEKLMSDSKNGNSYSATMVIEETPDSRLIKRFNKTPLESETNKEAKTPSKKIFSLNKSKENKTELGVKTSSFYGGHQLSLDDIRVKRFNRLHYNPKVKAKLFKDAKSTGRKRSKSTSQELKPKTHLFPGVILPLKKKPMAKKLFIKPELSEEKPSLEEIKFVKNFNLDIPKSLSKKKNWTEYIKHEKPQRIKIEEPENRKFFKSTIVHNDTPNKKEDNFNFNVVNWGDENMMSTSSRVLSLDIDNSEIMNDEAIEKIGQEVNDLIELLDDDADTDNDSTAIHFPGLTLKSTKRDHGDISNDEDSFMAFDSKRMKTDTENMPDLIRDAYDFDENIENHDVEQYKSVESVSATHLKDVSNTVESNIMAIESVNNSNDVTTVNGSPKNKLFPIFTNKTPSPNNGFLGSSEKKSSVRRAKRIMDASQYQIDAGQKKFGGFLCKQCGLYYSRGEPEDEEEHEKYHKAKDIFKYNSFRNEKVVYQDMNERIVVISGTDPKISCTKALQVMSFVDKELGFSTSDVSVLPATKKVYLYIKNKQVVGCLVVELISQAYRNLETGTEDMVIVSEESYPIKVGVNRIWTKWDCRKNGIATKLLDCFRKTYAYGHILTLDEIGFTVPTRAGKQFIQKYTNKNDYLVYTGW